MFFEAEAYKKFNIGVYNNVARYALAEFSDIKQNEHVLEFRVIKTRFSRTQKLPH